MWPSVSLPSSPYAAASGSAPTPTLSRTMTIARERFKTDERYAELNWL
jgi:hypothetical protein